MLEEVFGIDEDGYRKLDIQAKGKLTGKTLWDMETYINSLDVETAEISNINKYGEDVIWNEWPTVFVRTASDVFGIVVGDEFSPMIFRGENKYYKDFRPSAFRYSANPKGEERIRHCIDTIRKKEFLESFKETPYYSRCRKWEVLGCKFKFELEAIAQHFGFMSNYIDISKSFLVALFFAYTYEKDGEYRPITDFEEYNPMLYVGNLKEIYNNAPGQLRLISFQTMLRPFVQQAMAIEVSRDNNVKSLFKKIELPKEEVFAREIHAFYAYGQKLFMDVFFKRMASYIKNSKLLDSRFFDDYCKVNNLNAEHFINEIKQAGYEVTKIDYNILESDKRMMHKDIDENLLPLLGKIGDRICPDWLVDDK